MVTISLEALERYNAVQSRLAQLEAQDRERQETAAAEKIKRMAEKGEHEQALQTQRDELKKQIDTERAARMAIEDRAKRYALDGELSRTLSNYPLVPGGADQLTELWRKQFAVEPQGDSFQVRTPNTLLSVADFVASQLASDSFRHFLRAQNPGGGTSGGGTSGSLAPPTPPGSPPPAVQPKNLSEAAIMQWREMQTQKPENPAMDPSQPMGLHPLRKQA
jgi:hypothetical protein